MKANRNSVGILAALLLAVIAGALVWNSTRSTKSEADETVALAQVLVAQEEIQPGTFVADLVSDTGAALVAVVEVPVDQIAINAITTIADLEARAADGYVVDAVPIAQGAQLTTAQLIIPGQQDQTALGESVPPNLFEVTLALESQRALGGNIVPGKEVAVVVTFDADEDDPAQTVVVLDKVLVTNVETEAVFTAEQQQSNVLGVSQAATGRMYITFGVPVEDLEELTFAAENGRIWLAIQNEDATTEGSAIRDRDGVLGTANEADTTEGENG